MNNATLATNIEDVSGQLTKYLAAEGTQDSRRHILNTRLVSTGMNLGYKLYTERFEQRIKEYMRTPHVPMMQNEEYELPMYQLVQSRDWTQLMAMCTKYRMNTELVHNTLDVFTLQFSRNEEYKPQMAKYASETNTPETTCDNLQACVDLVDGGFFNFVAGIMEAYDRDINVTHKCIRVLYCMSTVMEHILRNMTPYLHILVLLGRHGLGFPTEQIMMQYRDIMIEHFNEMRPPSTMATSGGCFVLYAAMARVHNLIENNPDPPLDVVTPVCKEIIKCALTNRDKIKDMEEKVIGQAISTTVKWLKMSLQSTQSGHNEHQILALRFMYQLLLQEFEKYPRIMFKHGIVEVLVVGIARNNAIANGLLQGSILDAACHSTVMRSQFAFYDLMYFIFSCDLDFTTIVREFCKYDAFEHILETLRLAMNDASVFRFEFELQRSTSYRNILPGVLVAPYQKRCDGITSTYNIAEMAVVLACRMCQHALYGIPRARPDEIFATNLNKFKLVDVKKILLYACRSFTDNHERLKVENDPFSMDRDSFRQRGVSLLHIHRLATSLGMHSEYVETVVDRE